MANIGDKFIIEIAEEFKTTCIRQLNIQTGKDTEGSLYRVQGFSDLVLDESSLYRLERYDPDEKANADYDAGYAEGLNEAWEAARKIINMYTTGVGLLKGFDGAFAPYFDTEERSASVFNRLSAAEAIEKLKAYEKKKAEEELKVGDEVVDLDEINWIVVREPYQVGMRSTTMVQLWRGNIMRSAFANNITKTGRHFPQIAEVLKQLQEVDDK